MEDAGWRMEDGGRTMEDVGWRMKMQDVHVDTHAHVHVDVHVDAHAHAHLHMHVHGDVHVHLQVYSNTQYILTHTHVDLVYHNIIQKLRRNSPKMLI